MKARTSPNITIKRPTGFNPVTHEMYYGTMAVVPITAKSRRKFSLMSEDYITLEFSLASAVYFRIGDFVDDELFGRFFLTAEQMPKYNKATGGYDYSLRLDAEYRMWSNWLHCLVSEGKRMEASWSLTDRLEVHAQQIVDNLSALGYGGYNLDISASNAADVKFINYNGVSILAAMQTISDAYSCEWWVSMNDKIIHFGKCEGSDEPIVMSLGDNVESMDIANNRNTYANRIYVFGGTKNIPEDYDKRLIFTADGHQGSEWWDNSRPLTLDMLDAQQTAIKPVVFGDFVVSGDTLTATAEGFVVLAAGARLHGTININVLDNLSSGVTYTIAVTAYATGTASNTIYTDNGTLNTPQLNRTLNIDAQLSSNDYTKVDVVVTLTNTGSGTMTIGDNTITSDLLLEQKGVKAQKTLKIVGSSTAYHVTFNSGGKDWALKEAGRFTFDNGTPIDFQQGAQYTIEPLVIDIPQGYYTSEYSVGTLSKVGERRLHMPLGRYPHRYMQSGNYANEECFVERAIVMDDVYPKMSLEVADVRQETKRTQVKHEDGTVTYDNWPQYIIKLRKTDGTAFVFNTRWMLAGEGLRAHFTAPTIHTGQSGFLLAGMDFELGFSNASQEYTIIRNSDYGVDLPEDYLKPSVGDTLFLTGWNPRALADLGLIDDAEQLLADKAEEYLAAIEDGQFTFTCHMMSDWPFNIVGDLNFATSRGEAVVEAGSRWFCVKNGYTNYQLPIEGAKVTINHDALLSGSKTSRIIGYDLALDMPWDSPVYTVGETKAYSRLANIEQQITQLR